MSNPTSVLKSASEARFQASAPTSLRVPDPSSVGGSQPSRPQGVHADASPSILWRIVFAQTAFCVQISNNLGGAKPSWLTVSEKNEELVIPQEYLSSLQGLGSSPNLVTRYVVEVRSIPLHFTSYTAALAHVTDTLGLNHSQEWHADIVMPRKKGWFRR